MKTRNIEKGSCRRLVDQFSRLRASSRDLAAMRIIERETDSDLLQSWHLSLQKHHFEEFSDVVREAVLNSISDEVRKLCCSGDAEKLYKYAKSRAATLRQTRSTMLQYVDEKLSAGERQEVNNLLGYYNNAEGVFFYAVCESNWTVLEWFVENKPYVAPSKNALLMALEDLLKYNYLEMFQYICDNLTDSKAKARLAIEKHFLYWNSALQTHDGRITPVGRYLKTCVYGIHDDRQTDWFDESLEDRYYEIRLALGPILRKEKISGDEYYERFAKYAQIPTILPVLESGIMTSVNVLEDFWRNSTLVKQSSKLRRI